VLKLEYSKHHKADGHLYEYLMSFFFTEKPLHQTQFNKFIIKTVSYESGLNSAYLYINWNNKNE